MFSIENQRAPQALPDPVETARRVVEFQSLFGAVEFDGVRFCTVGALSAEANGPGTRKKAGYWRTNNTRGIRRLLESRGERLYAPHAESVLASHIEDGRLRVPVNRTPDVLAMLPGSQAVVVASVSAGLGARLVHGHVHPVYDHDADRRHDVMERVQRASALDVLAVLGIVDSMWGAK
jgi:hypothetical protein